MNVLWHEDRQTVGGIAERLALESSTLTPLLKLLETAGLIARARNPQNERQVIVELTREGLALQPRASCLAERMLATSDLPPERLGEINGDVRDLRDRIYRSIGGWEVPGDSCFVEPD
jgi:DNA-binding MarR family transcriptional regulator